MDPMADASLVRGALAADALRRSPGLIGPGLHFAAGAGVPPGAGGYGDPADGWNQELPGTAVEVVLELSGRWALDIDGRRHDTGAFAAGLVAGPARTKPHGAVRLVQLRVDPLATVPLFGVPAGELSGAAVDVDALLRPADAGLFDTLDAAFDADGAVGVAERWVQDQLDRSAADPARTAPADVRLACALLRASGGRLGIQDLAGELHCSRRHLARRFAEFVGVPPSSYARLLRFETATNALRDDPRQPLGLLAHAAGYADHAHMDRDFRLLARATPTAVAARFSG